MKPIRIQRKRTKGWKMPPNTVYVGRPTKWGNPFSVYCGKEPISTKRAIRYYRNWLTGHSKGYGVFAGSKYLPLYLRKSLYELRGKNLCCWCPIDQPCHADVLLELANQEQ